MSIDLDRVFNQRWARAELILNRSTRALGIVCMWIVALHVMFGWP